MKFPESTILKRQKLEQCQLKCCQLNIHCNNRFWGVQPNYQNKLYLIKTLYIYIYI